MENDESKSQEERKSEKKLRLDLSQVLDPNAEEDDEIIELRDEVIPLKKEEEAEIDIHDHLNEDMRKDEPSEEKVIDLDALSEETDGQEDVIKLADDLDFEEEDEGTDEIQAPVFDKPLEPESSDGVTEITEFEDILSEDDKDMVTLADLNAEDKSEDEFLELIDVEEDSEPEIGVKDGDEEIKDDIIQFDGPNDDVEDMELEDFINDSLNEEIRINDDIDEDLTSSLGIEAGSEINLADHPPETEEFDFNMDTSEIAEKIDQLETIFFDEDEAETEFDDEDALDLEAVEKPVTGTIEESENDDFLISEEEPSGERLADFEKMELSDEKPSEEPLPDFEQIELSDEEPSEEPLPDFEEPLPDFEQMGLSDEEPSEESLPDFEKTKLSDEEPSGDLLPDFEQMGLGDEEPSGEPLADYEQMGLSDEGTPEEPLPDLDLDGLNVSYDQIEKSIERIIQQNFSEKIETMITEVIEKAVSKEISRLKTILLEDDRDEDV